MYLTSLFLPLASSLTSGLFGRKIGSSGSHIISCTIIFASLALCLIIAYEVILCQSPCTLELFTWISTDQLSVNIGIHFDSLSVVMIVVVSTISSLVHLYSTWYIASDPHQQRFISFLSAFTFFIILLVAGDSYLLIFVGWEGIGILSFLLINFWTTRIQASKAAIQALTVNRIGDMFLSIGFFITLVTFSNVDYITVFSLSPYINTTILTIIGILFLLAAAGKSAQFGLHTWLVNAMEGPTPVSSMLHAATLVTAGIYLLIRSSPLLEYSPSSLVCILIMGSITCLFAASIGLLQNDLKRLIAYSTISQIGYLVLAVGLSQYNTALLHLAGHAYFKALLFLAAGGVLHSMADQQDMRRIGGLITLLPFTYTAILIGSFSLIAIFPLSGFYSKDLILELASGSYTFTGLIAYTIGTITAGCTAFYSIRLVGLTFTGRPHASQYLYSHTHDQPFIVQIPFVILILMSIFYGYICKDVLSGLGTDGLMNSTYNLISTSYMVDAEFQSQTIKLIPSLVTLSCATLALLLYTRSPISLLSIQSSSFGPSLYTFFNRKWLVDVVYGHIISIGLRLGALTSNIIDRGSLEILGPRGITQSLYTYSTSIIRLDNNIVTTYASYILISTVSLSFLCLISF